MKKLISLLALLCVLVCTACPVFADGVGRDDVLNGTYTDTAASDSSSADGSASGDRDTSDGSDMADATTGSVGDLTNLMNGVKEKWDELFGGLNGVLEFLTVCVGGSIGCLPASYIVYVVMLCVCISVMGVIKEIGDKKK